MKLKRPGYGKMEAVLRLVRLGKTTREIAKDTYGDETERGQKRVRAIKSKLRKSGKLSADTINNSSSNKRMTIPTQKRMENRRNRKRMEETGRLPQQSCGGVVNTSQPVFEIVRAPVAGSGSRLGYVLERDVVTAVLCDAVAAKVIQKVAVRLTGAGFFLYYDGSVTFQSKGDVVSISECDGNLDRACLALAKALKMSSISSQSIKKIVAKVRHPSQIAYDELTIDINAPEMIQAIRQSEPYIPNAGRGPYVILAPSPLIPGLKIYMKSPSCLRIEFIAHNEKQAFNAFFIRAELVGDVLPQLRKSQGVFDEWRAQYWHLYSHPMIINLNIDADSLPKASYKKISRLPRGERTFDSLPPDIRETLKDLSSRGVVYFNDFSIFLSDKAKRQNRKDPSNIAKQLRCADPLSREIVFFILRKVATNYDQLLEHLESSIGIHASKTETSPKSHQL